MTAMLSQPVSTAWARLVRAQRAVLDKVERGLKDAGLPPLAWYDVLLELGRAKSDCVTPGDLEHRCLLEQYNLSRLLDRMQARNLVCRLPYPGDKRRQLVKITDEGRAMQKRMWPVYAAAVQRALGDRLSEDEATQLAALLGTLTGPAPETCAE